MRSRLAVPLLFAAWVLAAPAATFAQSASQRADIQQFRDSLSHVADSAVLKALEAAQIEIAKQNRDDPMIHIRLGFIAYRLGEVTGNKGRYDDAAGEFEWAGELAPDWPVPWYGLGLSELALGEHWWIALENLRQILQKDYLSKAAQAFARAAEADPTFVDAVVDLAATALQQRIAPRLDVALTAVRQAAASEGGRDPRVQLARGRIEREVGEADSARVAFERYLTVGGDSVVGLLELARSLFFLHRNADAERTYYSGAALARTAGGVELYRSDLEWIAQPEELAAWDSLHGGRAEWLRRFWEKRDVADARLPGERLAEHYRRYFHARQNFRLVSRHRYYELVNRYRPTQREFDDRGVIYLRHGAPDDRARMILDSVPNESWVYRRHDGNLLFHFAAFRDVQDFRLVESVVDLLGFGARITAAGGRVMGAQELFDSRAHLDPIYRRSTTPMTLSSERRIGQRSLETGVKTDSYHPSYETDLQPAVSDFVVGDGQGGARLQLVFALPTQRLRGDSTEGAVIYPVHLRLIVSDTAERPVARLDTVRYFRVRGVPTRGTHLQGAANIPVPAGDYRYRLLVDQANAGVGQLIRRDSLGVGRLDGSRFDASGLVVGRDGTGLVWVSGRDTIGLDPFGRMPEGVPARVYFEVYGLSAGDPYRVRLRLTRQGGRSLFGAIAGLFGGGGREPVLLEYDAVATGTATHVSQTLDLRGAKRGRYVLTLELVHSATNATVTRARAFEITAP
jgi:tetratricopeptide (TPR) repeat protein